MATAKNSKAKKALKKVAAKKSKVPAQKAERKNHPEDIIKLILMDHKPLKSLIKILKNTDKPNAARKEAFIEFAALLTLHAKAEEQSLYIHMKKIKDLREDGLEGDVEHILAEQLIDETKRATDEDLWSARAKVLAELVEHHVEEEEEDMFPDFVEDTALEERVTLGKQYLRLKAHVKTDEREVEKADEREDVIHTQLQ